MLAAGIGRPQMDSLGEGARSCGDTGRGAIRSSQDPILPYVRRLIVADDGMNAWSLRRPRVVIGAARVRFRAQLLSAPGMGRSSSRARANSTGGEPKESTLS